jgi:hypothetical protein
MEAKVGRPSKFTQEIADTICQAIADGMSLRKVCQDEDMPATATVCRWLSENKQFQEQYAHARELQADMLFDEVLDIADDGKGDTYTDDNGEVRTNHDVIARSRLRVDARKWMAGKLRPKKYGEFKAVELTGQDGAPFMPPTITFVTGES